MTWNQQLLVYALVVVGFVLAIIAPVAGKRKYDWTGLWLSLVAPLLFFIFAVEFADYYIQCHEKSECFGKIADLLRLIYWSFDGMILWLVSAILTAIFAMPNVPSGDKE